MRLCRIGASGSAAGRRSAPSSPDWYADPGQFLDLERTAIPGGELVEFTLTWMEEGVPHRVHQAHILQVAEGRVSRDTAFCGGRWPADLVQQMEEAGA